MATETNRISNTHNRPKRKPKRRLLLSKERNEENFISSISCLIAYTVRLTKTNPSLLADVDEMVHSIFFLGYIHKPTLTPGKFFTKPAIAEIAKKEFPGPFEKYNSHLPFRTPFSILLDMMKIIHGTEEKILTELPLLLEKLKFPPPLHQAGNKNELFYTLESTVICVCYSDSNTQRYYGASLSCRKGNSKRILIDISCLKTWHELVSHAVMSFYSEGPRDGITFPESVKCQAYFRDQQVYKERRPCSNCKQLFNLINADLDKVDHPYGNCAETECLSKLLFNYQNIRENTQIKNYTEENLKTLRDSTKARLIEQLHRVNFQINNDKLLFYSPMQ